MQRAQCTTLFPYTTPFRSRAPRLRRPTRQPSSAGSCEPLLFEEREHLFGGPRAASLKVGDAEIDGSSDLVLVTNEVTQGSVCQRATWTAGELRQPAQLLLH